MLRSHAAARTLVTSGGRVLCVTALGDNVRAAQSRALAAVRGIRFAGAQWRSDIGHRALEALRAPECHDSAPPLGRVAADHLP